MASFFNPKTSHWSGLMKQAISSMETQIDKVLDIKGPASQDSAASGAGSGLVVAGGDFLDFWAPPSLQTTVDTFKPLPLESSIESAPSIEPSVEPQKQETSHESPVSDSTPPSLNPETASTVKVNESTWSLSAYETEAKTETVISGTVQADLSSVISKEPPLKTSSSSSSIDNKNVTIQELRHLLAEREEQLMRMQTELASRTAQESSSSSSSSVEGSDILIQQLKGQLEAMRVERDAAVTKNTSAKSVVERLTMALQNKEMQIQELMKEGESLSVANGKLSQALKASKSKYTETQQALTALEQRHQTLQSEVQAVQGQLKESKASEQSMVDQVRMVEVQAESHQKRAVQLEKQATQLSEENAVLKVSLERAQTELSELRKENAAQLAQVQSKALDQEINTNLELKKEIEKVKLEASMQLEAVQRQLVDCQQKLAASDAELLRAQDMHRIQIEEYERKVSILEATTQDSLSDSHQLVTEPLLQQINKLQSQLNISQERHQKTETQLLSEMDQVRNSLAQSQATLSDVRLLLADKEKLLRDLTTQLQEHTQERTHTLKEKQELEQRLAQERSRADAFSEQLRHAHEEQTRLRDMQGTFEQQLQHWAEKERLWERDQGLLQTLLKEREGRSGLAPLVSSTVSPGTAVTTGPSSAPPPLPSSSLGPLHSTYIDSSSIIPPSPTETALMGLLSIDAGGGPSQTGIPVSTLPTSRHAFLASSSSHLHSTVSDVPQQQLGLLLDQIRHLHRQRDDLSTELMTVKQQLQQLQDQQADYQQCQNQLQDLQQRHGATLILLGERTEKVDELLQDIADMKEAYQSQLLSLLKS